MLLYQLIKDPILLLLALPSILIALTFHEWAHGWAASKCGDMTARNMGRLSLNPLHHLDPVGTLMMLLVGFGWARPVPVNPRNFRNPKRDFGIVAAAGPVMNFLLAFIGTFFMSLAFAAMPQDTTGFAYKLTLYTFQFFYYFSFLNIGLGTFNLIPLPPLDGSRILTAFLPPKAAFAYNKIEPYARYILLGIVLLTWLPEPFSNIVDYIFYPVDWLRSTIFSGYTSLWSWIFGI